MSPPVLVFHRFRDLPTELRLAIWQQCLPQQRVAELDYNFWAYPGCLKAKMITDRNKVPPLITRVCRESRQVAFNTGRQLPVVLDPNKPDGIQQFSGDMVEHPWLDTARDVVHINWDPEYDFTWPIPVGWVDPVHCVASFAAQTALQRASIRLDVLQSVFFGFTDYQLASMMRAQAPSLSWTVVIMQPIVVHAITAATVVCDNSLFGFLGDAPVQLVDAGNDRKIDEFLRLGDRPGVTITPSPKLRPNELGSLEHGFWDMVDDIFGHRNQAPAMHPAVMFRLCVDNCGAAKAITVEN